MNTFKNKNSLRTVLQFSLKFPKKLRTRLGQNLLVLIKKSVYTFSVCWEINPAKNFTRLAALVSYHVRVLVPEWVRKLNKNPGWTSPGLGRHPSREFTWEKWTPPRRVTRPGWPCNLLRWGTAETDLGFSERGFGQTSAYIIKLLLLFLK